MTRELKTVRDFAGSGPFSESQLRWWIFRADVNGLNEAAAVVRVGRRVYLDVEGFERWLVAQNPSLRTHAEAARA